MRTADRAIAALLVLIGTPAVCPAAGRSERGRPDLDHLLAQIPAALGRDQAPTPRAIPPAGPGGPSVDLAGLSDPVGLERRLRRLLLTKPAELNLTVAGGQARLGDFSVGSNESVTGHVLVLRGDADLSGRVNGNIVTLDGDVVLHPGAVVTGDALAIGGRVRDRGGVVQGESRALGAAPVERAEASPGAFESGFTHLAGLVGVFLTLALIGFGGVLFAKPNLETISDTVSQSLFRSFLAGLLAQVLVIPTFGMLVMGLVLSLVGILLLPFVVIAFLLLFVAAVVGGFLAVAHAMGETHLRRRMAAGVRVGSANSYRYLLTGLGGIAAIWLGWVLFGWVPIAGVLMFAAAFLASWMIATIGFGACLLSRAGVTPSFAGRYVPPEALTDEYLWATPQFGVTAVKRPAPGKPLNRGDRP